MLVFIENLGVIYGVLGYVVGSTLLGLIMLFIDKKRLEETKILIMGAVRSIELQIWGRTWDKSEVKNEKKKK